VVLMGINAERAAIIEFSQPYLEVEQGVLLRPGVKVAGIDDIYGAELRIGALEGSGADAFLSRQPRALQIVRAASLDALFVELAAGRIDMVAATKSRLFAEAAKLAGSRLLDGRLLVEPIGMGVAKNRPAAAASYMARFVEEAKAGGMVAAAITRANLLGVTVPPAR
jgi:polar amino acid transport system substrate-binding protein